MYFFNLVYMMLLVEVICGEKIGEIVIVIIVVYVKKMGKSLIVVNDCFGFLVNCVLFLYFGGFVKLLSFGVDFVCIDKVMEKFGWFMGLVYLFDVVGIDIGYYGCDVMVEGFLDCMVVEGKIVVDVMYEVNCLGQKNGKGFYVYEIDKCGKLKKVIDLQVYEVFKLIVVEQCEVIDEDIVNFMMILLCLEIVCCLEDGIVEIVVEVDMGLIYGIGFLFFCGGVLCYIDLIGVVEFVVLVDKYVELGVLYYLIVKLCEMVKNGQKFFG